MNKEYLIVYSPEAKNDLKEIYAYIAFELKAFVTAANLVQRIRESIRDLSKFPFRYQMVEWEPWASMGMHRFSVNNYAIFYFVDEDEATVEIVHIFYGGRDIENTIKG